MKTNIVGLAVAVGLIGCSEPDVSDPTVLSKDFRFPKTMSKGGSLPEVGAVATNSAEERLQEAMEQAAKQASEQDVLNKQQPAKYAAAMARQKAESEAAMAPGIALQKAREQSSKTALKNVVSGFKELCNAEAIAGLSGDTDALAARYEKCSLLGIVAPTYENILRKEAMEQATKRAIEENALRMQQLERQQGYVPPQVEAATTPSGQPWPSVKKLLDANKANSKASLARGKAYVAEENARREAGLPPLYQTPSWDEVVNQCEKESQMGKWCYSMIRSMQGPQNAGRVSPETVARTFKIWGTLQ